MHKAIDLLEEKQREMVVVSADTTVVEALRMMVGNNIGAIVAEENARIAGIWTERDLMRNTLEEGFDPHRARIGDCMTRDLYTAPTTFPSTSSRRCIWVFSSDTFSSKKTDKRSVCFPSATYCAPA